jgi:dihydroorotate dehydrogenase electron transfer subunit
MMLQIKAKIIYNKRVNADHFHLAIAAPKIAKTALPGQFLNIKVNDECEPLLRRPISIHRVKGASVELFYEIVGEATEILSHRRQGEHLDIIGPLGSGFIYKAGALLVAGGMGVAPLVFLAEKLAQSSKLKAQIRPLVFIGAKTKNHILCEKEFKKIGCEVTIATDDGSKGFKGYVSELLDKTLSTVASRPSTIYACGPRPMLKEVSRVARKYNIPSQVSMEEHMACGIGACLGCVINTEDGYRRACKEAPVFDAQKIIW